MNTSTNNSFKETSKSSWQIMTVTLCAAFVVAVLPGISFADGNTTGGGVSDVFANTLCGVANWFNGSTGKAVATVAVIFLGIAAFFGKVTWGLALMFAVGIFAIFGASSIVNSVADGQVGASSGCNCK